MSPLELTAATDRDRDFARDLTRRAMLPYYQTYGLHWSEQGFDQAWSWREHWLVKREGHTLGYCSLSRDRQALYIRELHLLPEWRGQGAGGWVLEQMAIKAALDQLPWIRLMVFKCNPARHLYRRAGFHYAGEDGCFLRLQRAMLGDAMVT